VQLVTTVLKLLPCWRCPRSASTCSRRHDSRLVWHPAGAPPISAAGITAAASLTLWALLGFESASVAAQRVVDPERTIPRATVIGCIVVAAIYILSCTAVLLLTPAAAAGDLRGALRRGRQPLLG
jgi:APA family basic amino acid/polyamine antiporter